MAKEDKNEGIAMVKAKVQTCFLSYSSAFSLFFFFFYFISAPEVLDCVGDTQASSFGHLCTLTNCVRVLEDGVWIHQTTLNHSLELCRVSAFCSLNHCASSSPFPSQGTIQTHSHNNSCLPAVKCNKKPLPARF